MNDRSGPILELQSLRGIAAAMVAIGHTLTFYYTGTGYGSMVLNGRGAVVIFFVLSGYVLTRSLRNSEFDRHSIICFYVQRIFRIYPAIWVISGVALWYLMTLHWQVPLADGSYGADSFFRRDRFNDLWIIGSFTGMIAYLLPQLWSIHVEILGSLLMPAIAYVALRRRRSDIWLLLLLTVSMSYFLGSYTPYHSALFFMDFIVGAMLANGAATPMLQRLPYPKLLIAGGLVAMMVTRFLPFDYWSPSAHAIETMLAALVIGLLAESPTPNTLMNSRPLLFIGEISYSIYLLHFVVQCILAKIIAVVERHEHLTLDAVLLSILLAVSTGIVTVALAWVSFSYIEKPGIRLGRMLLMRWQNSSPTLVAHRP